MQIHIGDIRIKEGRRSLDTGHVKELADSIRELGLLNPVTIDKEYTLIAGLHRLEAVRRLGWVEVECTMSSLNGLQAELAEIDENIIRSGLPLVEYGEILLRRKEIYEALHPEARNGGDRRSGKTRSAKCTSEPVRSFVEDTAEKLGVNPCTVRRQIQTAKNLSPEAKEIIRDSDAKLSKKEALKLSRLGPQQQKEAAALLAAKEIRSVEEYTEKSEKTADTVQPEKTAGNQGRAGETHTPEPVHTQPSGEKTEPGRQPGQEGVPAVPVTASTARGTASGSNGVNLKEIIAELKDPDKDCSGTPDSFLQEYAAFVRKFHREIGWYSDPYYDAVYPFLTEGQLAELKGLTDSLCLAARGFFRKVKTAVKQKGQ